MLPSIGISNFLDGEPPISTQAYSRIEAYALHCISVTATQAKIKIEIIKIHDIKIKLLLATVETIIIVRKVINLEHRRDVRETY